MKGRPRKFSLEQGLDMAESSFMQFGYEGTSISLLCKQLNIPPTSLYAAYKDKQNLFREVLCRHADNILDRYSNMLSECETTGQVYRGCLELGVELIYEQKRDLGILFLDLKHFVKNQEVEENINQYINLFSTLLYNAFDAKGSDNPAELANVVLTLLRGMSSAARSGKSEVESLTTVEFFCVGFDC